MSAEAADSADKLIGEVLASRYKIEQRLGEGAMGVVYRARHVKVGRPFAVKVLHSHLLVDAKQIRRFEREAELAGRLRHPNVIGVVDVGETPDGLRYMVMDFAAGPDLATLMSEAPMPAPRIIQLVRQLLEGLFHAHEQGLIHRDFKPENVIVEHDSHDAEVPRIVDFGIAILREGADSSDAPRLTTNGLVLGTPQYMAPEQAVADPIDHRIDLFALGIMMYELLSGRLPFDGSGAEVARANLLLDPPPISERVPYLEVDPLLEAFARRLLAKKRDARPPTAKAARELLDLIAHDRVAAAAALGVPLTAARGAKDTQPVASRLVDSSSSATYPPPFRADPVAQVVTPPQAPRLAAPVAIAVDPPQREIATEPVPLHRSRRRWPIVAGGVAVVGAVAIVGVLAPGRGGNDVTPAPHEAPVVAVAPVAPAQPVATPPSVAPPPLATPDPTPPVTPKPSPQPPVRPHHDDHHVLHSVVKPPDPKPAEIAVVAPTPPAPSPTPTPTPAVAKPPEDPNNAFVAKYTAVNAELNAFQKAHGKDATADLWNRYRYIRLTDCYASVPKRAEAMKILDDIHAKLASGAN